MNKVAEIILGGLCMLAILTGFILLNFGNFPTFEAAKSECKCQEGCK